MQNVLPAVYLLAMAMNASAHTVYHNNGILSQTLSTVTHDSTLYNADGSYSLYPSHESRRIKIDPYNDESYTQASFNPAY